MISWKNDVPPKRVSVRNSFLNDDWARGRGKEGLDGPSPAKKRLPPPRRRTVLGRALGIFSAKGQGIGIGIGIGVHPCSIVADF